MGTFISRNPEPLCLKNCNQFINGTDCVSDCGGWFVHSDRQHCVKSCTNGTFVNNVTSPYCVSVCPVGYYTNETECVSDCGSRFITRDTGHCVETCPYGTFINNITSPFCVSKCPEPYYTKSVECVLDCGDWMVDLDGSTCVKSCAADKVFISDELELVKGKTYIRKKCKHVRNLPFHFIFNDTNVPMCPSGFKHIRRIVYSEHSIGTFLYENYITLYFCKNKCPTDEEYIMNVTLFGKNYFECVSSCNEFSEGYYCTDNCSAEKVILNKKCYSKCPDSHPVVSVSGQCLSSCDDSVNGNTTNCKCPSQRPFFYNGTCSKHCPSSRLYRTDIHGVHRCVDVCNDDEYVFNNSCVNRCPVKTFFFKKNCLPACPTGMFSCLSENGLQCSEKGTFSACLIQCPKDMFQDDDKCLHECSDFGIEASRLCVKKCPKDIPLTVNRTTGILCSFSACKGVKYELFCVEQCPFDMFRQGNVCLHYCTEKTKLLNKTCILDCPTDTLSRLKTVQYVEYGYHLPYGIWRRQQYQKQFIECVDDCGENRFILNSTCVDYCPTSHIYATNSVCSDQPCATSYSYNNSREIICSDECTRYGFSYNNICLPNCPTPYVYNGTCVNECPLDFPYKETHMKYTPENRIEYTACVSFCSGSRLLLNDTCQSECTEPYLVINKTCVLECPLYAQFIHNRQCVSICQSKNMCQS